ncbi:22831_t:CDS:2, partial [Gigaspora rosea]
MRYDEEQRVALVMNCDSTPLNKDIKKTEKKSVSTGINDCALKRGITAEYTHALYTRKSVIARKPASG